MRQDFLASFFVGNIREKLTDWQAHATSCTIVGPLTKNTKKNPLVIFIIRI